MSGLPVQPTTFDSDRATVAANVTRLIESHRLSFGEAARITGISKTGLYKIADGTSDPCLSSLCKIAGAFGVSLASLFGQDGNSFTREDVAKLRKPPELYGGLQNGRDDVEWYDFCYSIADRIAPLLPLSGAV